MQENVLNPESGQSKKADDEIDILEIVSILIAKWPILIAFVLVGMVAGFFVANYIRPAFSSDALLQVDQNGSSAGLALGDMGAMLDVASPADAEIQLIQSRRVLEVVVEAEHLSYDAIPVALLPRLLHQEGRVDVGYLRLPRTYDPKARWFLEASQDSSLADSSYQIVDPMGKVVLKGRVGDTYRIPLAGDTLAVLILNMMASPNEKFRLSESDPRQALDALRGRLTVAEQGKKTGIIRMEIQHRYADRAAKILNTIADTYVRQNVEARSKEATKTLEFLEEQLPAVKAKLDSSEQILSSYRQEEGSIDLNGEARSALEKRMDLERHLLELQQKYQETTRLFKEDHPTVLALKKQQQQVRREMVKLVDETKDLPAKQQEILRLQGDVNVNSAIYTNMMNNIQQLRVVQAGEVGNARVVDRARIELTPVKPRKKVILLGFIAGGFAAGAVLIFLLRVLSNRGIRSSSEVERETGVSVYARIPETRQSKNLKKFTLVEQNSDDLACEALRTLRTSLEFSMMDSKVLLITGITQDAGKSFVAKNLSALFAMNGKKVLLVDVDFRASVLSHRGRKRGLSDYLLGKLPLEEALEHLNPQMDLLGAGSFSSSPSEMISSKAFESLIDEMKSKYDLIVIDSAPVLAVADALIASRYSDFVLIVVRYGHDSMEALREGLGQFDKANVKHKAIVFNRCVYENGHGYGYGYGYGYGNKYGYGKKKKKS